MSLALYPSRVRSNDVLERARRSLTKLIESLATTLSGVCPTSVTPDRRALPQLEQRMPPTTQRRNTAYLNRRISRTGQLYRVLEGQAPGPRPDLRLISGARSSRASDPTTLALPTWTDCLLAGAA
jgi:hypothetical protein